MTPVRRHVLLWLGQRLAGLLLAGGLAIHLFQVWSVGGAALVARPGGGVGWPLFYAGVVGLALIHGGLGVHGLWRERRHGLAALSIQRLTGIALVLFVPVHVSVSIACVVCPALAATVFQVAALPLHRGFEAAVVALVVGHGLGGLRVLALEGLLWSRGQKALAWIAAGLTMAAAVAVPAGAW